MFFIVNKTEKTVVISDIGITLGPRQAIDLDKVIDRSKSDNSKFLKLARKKGVIDVRRKDGEIARHSSPKNSKPNDLDSFKKEIVDEIKDAISQQFAPVQAGISPEQLETMMKTLIASMPKSTETIIIQKGDSKEVTIRTDDEVEINEDVLVDINARTVDNIVEGSDIKYIKYKEESQENTILDNVDELEGLL